jgi:glucokinase
VKRLIIGIDIGGTKISVTLAGKRGTILAAQVFSSLQGRKPDRSIDEIESAVRSLTRKLKMKPSDWIGVGVGMPGAIDPSDGTIRKSPNLKGWERLKLDSILRRRFRVPVVVENDANAAALGEKYFGAGRGVENFLYLTVSTGIGSGIVANGRLVRGDSGLAGEAGHMTVVRKGLLCSCGKRGCLEAYSSGTAIAEHARNLLRGGAKSDYLKRVRLNQITGSLVSQAARVGDRVAIQARRMAAEYLGVGLANIIQLLNPKCIILGGGVMEHVNHFWKPMMESVKRETWPISFRSCKIVRSKLGGRVGDLGAIALVMEHMKRDE